jgi:hypothetical protein
MYALADLGHETLRISGESEKRDDAIVNGASQLQYSSDGHDSLSVVGFAGRTLEMHRALHPDNVTAIASLLSSP